MTGGIDMSEVLISIGYKLTLFITLPIIIIMVAVYFINKYR